MKKIFKTLILFLVMVSCSLLNKVPGNAEYRDFEAVIKTDKGDINVFLYEGYAPETVANFIYLSKKGFYNGLKFHRVEDAVIQGGDPYANGTGGTGYILKDEFNNGLKFNFNGILAMANAGKNSSSSQFFITKYALPMLNGGYTIFGSLKTEDDLTIASAISKDDIINSIEIKGKNLEKYLKEKAALFKKWDAILEPKMEEINKIKNNDKFMNSKKNDKKELTEEEKEKLEKKRKEALELFGE